jgi:hypothetical protein
MRRVSRRTTSTARGSLSGPPWRAISWASTEGVKVLDVTDLANPKPISNLPLPEANNIYLARTYAYVAGGRSGLIILDITNPEIPRIDQIFDAGGCINDLHDVKLGITYTSEFAYLADGCNGMRVVQLTSPDTPGSAGFSPRPFPRLIATHPMKKGGRALAIPHNGNLSNGLMFDDVTLTTKKPLDRAYAEQRQRWEPLYETTQMKGDGETHPSLSPSDEFANFERWDKGSFGPELKTPAMLPREYTREALKRGLAYEQSLGVNPFKFGLIGSTDSHTALSTAQENNFFGKVATLEPSAVPKVPVPKSPYIAVVYRYADTMLEKGRDTFGPQKTGLLLSARGRWLGYFLLGLGLTGKPYGVF